MSVDIMPLEREDREAAAELLARRHAMDRRREWELPDRYDDPGAALELIDALMDAPASVGVIARRNGRAAGFLAGLMRTPSPLSQGAKFVRARSALVPYQGFALADREDGELLRELYAALSPVWVERGYFSHYIEIPALDVTAADAFGSLGFGRQMTLAVRGVAEPVEDAQEDGFTVRRAGPDDLRAILWLGGLLGEHHAASPSYLAYLREPDQEIEATVRGLLEDAVYRQFIALRGETVLGAQTFRAPETFSPLARPERAVYLWEGIVAPSERRSGVGSALLAKSMAWATGAGFSTCVLHFLSANLAGARFWQANGFWPLTHTLARHIDERIAWANR
jgi:ribosomal protein S18 acetylase RimI-like enzyme